MPNVRRLNHFTGKKVIILGHSFGNLSILHVLNHLHSKVKSKLIHSWLSVVPPFLGALKATQVHISGDNDFIYMRNYFGLKVKAAIEAINNIISTYELAAKDPFNLFNGHKWFEAVKKRMSYEEFEEIKFEDSGFQFLPKKESKCTPEAFKLFP